MSALDSASIQIRVGVEADASAQPPATHDDIASTPVAMNQGEA
jgi:hypothetical protein